MKTQVTSIATFLVLMAASGNSAFAQSMRGGGTPSMGGSRTTTNPGTTGGTIVGGTMGGLVNGYGGGEYGGAATIEGSYLSGAAALAEGLGKYNYDSARAARQLEAARRQASQNRLLEQSSYYELRRLNEANWLAEHPRSTPEQLAQIDRSRLPRRLNPSELDRTWGVIDWPAVLERPKFEKFRDQFNEIFAHRSDERFGVGSAIYSRTQALAHDMRASLDEQRDSMSQMEWIQAMRFIESLAYETRFASDATAGQNMAAK